MICTHCGKEIDKDSEFCKYCGAVVVSSTPVVNIVEEGDSSGVESNSSVPSTCGDFENHDKINSNSGYHPPKPGSSIGKAQETDDSSTIITKLIPILIIAAFAVLIVVIAPHLQDHKVSSAQTNSSELLTEIEESEYHEKMRFLYFRAVSMSERMVREQLSKSETAKFDHDWDAFSNDGVILTHRGTVDYNNKNGVDVTQSFEASFVVNDEFFGHDLALKLGDTTLYDFCYTVDKNGKIISDDCTFYGRGYGEQILDELYNPDKWAKDPNDFKNSEEGMTSDEYNAIQVGMTYDEVCKIVGSYGTELSRAEMSGYQTVIVAWNGSGSVGANANVTFQNGKVIVKAQAGLQAQPSVSDDFDAPTTEKRITQERIVYEVDVSENAN